MESFNEVWELVLSYCKKELSAANVAYKVWIEIISPVSMVNEVATLQVKTDFQKSIIEKQYLTLLKNAFFFVLGFDVEINIIAKEKYAEIPRENANIPVPRNPGDYEFTFDTFIQGPSNQFALSAAHAVCANPGTAYNPLFIYGNSGLGKTHLLLAIYKEIKELHPGWSVIYMTGEQFTNEFLDALKSNTTQGFKSKYRSCDFLLLDDIQFISGKVQTEEEFFHTFNDLIMENKQIVLTSDRPPKEMVSLAERIRTRFSAGLLADIQPPEMETRMAIIKRKAELMHFSIPGDVIEFVAKKLKSDIRQLEGTVKKLKAYNDLDNTQPSIAVAQLIIKDVQNDSQPVSVTMDKIILEVSRTFGVPEDDIRSTKRTAAISEARQISMYIAREITGMSVEEIGNEFGGRNHATVSYATKQIEIMITKDRRKKEMISDIMKNVRGY